MNFLTHDEDDLVGTVKDLARALEGKDLLAVVALEWWYGGTSPGTVIKCTPGEVDTVALMLKQSVSAVRARVLVARRAQQFTVAQPIVAAGQD